MKRTMTIKIFLTGTFLISMLLIFGCVRNVPLDKGIALEPNSREKINQKILVVMDQPSSTKVIVFKPGPFADKFSLNGGESIKSNILDFMSSRFQEVDFENTLSENNSNYDYYLKVDWKDHKIDMGASIFSQTKTNIYINYHLMNPDKKVMFTSETDGNSLKGLTGGEIATAINPFVFIGTKKAEQLIANSWNEALANSISKFSLELESYIGAGK